MEKLFLAIPCLVIPMIGITAAVVVILVVLVIFGARKRDDAFVRQAAAWGLEYRSDDPWDLPKRYRDTFDFFRQGSSRRASHVMTGKMDGAEVLLFEYRYTSGSGDNESTWYYAVAILGLPIQAPHLQLRDENVIDKVAAWVGHDDINFESAEFSRRYYVKCDEPRFAHDFFHPRLIEYLLACGHCPGLETRGTQILLYEPGQGDVKRLVRLVEVGRHMIASLPDYVRHERAAGAGGAANA